MATKPPRARIPPGVLEAAEQSLRQFDRLEGAQQARLQTALARAAEVIDDRLRQPLTDGAANELALQRALIAAVREEYGGTLEERVLEAWQQSWRLAPLSVEREIGAWVEDKGATPRPLDLRTASALDEGLVLQRIGPFCATFGEDMGERVRELIQTAQIARLDRSSVADILQRSVVAERYKAERIVRTEMAQAYNAAHQQTLYEARDSGQVPGLKKSCVAVFDSRTALDSYPVHGQVRELEAPFIDGEGRRYQHPPGRPNDREKEIPWLEEVSAQDLDAAPRPDGATPEQVAAEDVPLVEQRRRAREAAALAVQASQTFEGRREILRQGWTALEDNATVHQMQASARDALGLDAAYWGSVPVKLDAAQVEQTGQDLQRLYAETQAYYKAAGITEVRLYKPLVSEVDVVAPIESWTTSFGKAQRLGTYDVISETIPVERLLWAEGAPGWPADRGDEVALVMPARPHSQWTKRDFEIGFSSARDLDKQAERRGQWGIVVEPATAELEAQGVLWHLPSQRALVSGSFSRQRLREVADYLEREGALGAGVLEDGTDQDAIRATINAALLESTGGRGAYRAIQSGIGSVWKRQVLDLGPDLDTSTLDADAERAGPWGVFEYGGDGKLAPGGALYHLPSGQRLLAGSYTRADLKSVAARLDALVGKDGALPVEDEERAADFLEELAAARAYTERNRVTTMPSALNTRQFVDVGGVEFPAINAATAKFKTRGEGWTGGVIKVLTERGPGEFEEVEREGWGRGNFFIYKTQSSYSTAAFYDVHDWHIVHAKTGIELHTGTVLNVSERNSRMTAIGGWKQSTYKEIAKGFEELLNADGSPKDAEKWLEAVAALQRQTAPGEDVAPFLRDRFVPEEWYTNPILRRVLPSAAPPTEGADVAASLKWLDDAPDLDEKQDEWTDDLPF